jgi:hypothetical protein
VVNYTLSLVTDPLAGPYTTTVNTYIGFATVNLRLTQWTAGPVSNLVVLFNDGTANIAYNGVTAGTSINITHTFTVIGTYNIQVTCTLVGIGGTTVVNSITVNVATTPTYQSNHINILACVSLFMYFNQNNWSIFIKYGLALISWLRHSI